MRALADFIMRGRVQASIVVAGCAALPLLFWLSAAAGSLVFLRRGFKDASSVIVWGILPALAWWIFGEPRTLMVLLGTLGLAVGGGADRRGDRARRFAVGDVPPQQQHDAGHAPHVRDRLSALLWRSTGGAFYASGAHVLRYAPLRFSKTPPFASPQRAAQQSLGVR